MKPITSNTYKMPLWGKGVLLILSISGVVAIFQICSHGHIITNATQNTPWGLWVATYLYFIGLSAGSFLFSSLIYVFRMKQFEAAGHVALVQAFICILIAGIFIILDLGHPSRMANIIFSMNLTSVMAWMGIIYGLYLLVIVLEMYFSMSNLFIKNNTGQGLPENILTKHKNTLFWLGLIGILIAIGVLAGEGIVFAVAKARPNWFGGLFPIVLIISALASGGGMLTFLSGKLISQKEEEKKALMQIILYVSLGFLVFDYLLLSSEMFTAFYGGIKHDYAAWDQMLFGKYWYTFWFIQLCVGLLFPIYIAINKEKRNSVSWLGAAGLSIAVGIFGARLNLVMPAQFSETLEGLSEAYHHYRFTLGYFPSANEIMLVLGGVALFTWLFLAANKYLPLNTEEHKS